MCDTDRIASWADASSNAQTLLIDAPRSAGHAGTTTSEEGSDVMRKLVASVGLTLLAGSTLAPGLLNSPAAAEAIGGTITHQTVFGTTSTIHTFTSTGTFTIPPGTGMTVNYLLVAGGGG